MQRTCPKCKHVNITPTAGTLDACPQCGALYARAAQEAERKTWDWRYKALFGILAVLVPFTIYDNIWGVAAKVRKSEAQRKVAQQDQKQAVVFNSSWDGSVHQVERWLKSNLKDPASLEFVEWSPVVAGPNNDFEVRVKYRAKNGFGGYAVEQKLFRLDASGSVVAVINA